MASIVFSNIVANPNATLPTSLNLSLTSNGVDLQTVGSNVKALVFNAVATPSGTTTTYAVTANGIKTTFRASNSYDTKAFALVLNNNTSYTFTLDQANPIDQTLTFNNYDTITPESLRLWNLNG